MKLDKISVIGLGKLGACLAACLAYRDFEVLGVDVIPEVVQKINMGIAPVQEPDLQEIMNLCNGRLTATMSHEEAIEQTDVSVILVATPSDSYGKFSNKHIISAIGDLGVALSRSKKKNHLFVISSTVMPTSIERQIIPLLEETSGRKLNKGFQLCYCPEAVALGSVCKNFLLPDFVVIGESCEEAGQHVQNIYTLLCEQIPPFHRMSIVNAEIAKVALNTFLTTKISYANDLANMCEAIEGADCDLITNAIGDDPRIGRKFLKGGLAFSGFCFPRDTKAWIALAKSLGEDASFILAVDEINKKQDRRLLKAVQNACADGQSVGILGLSFKPGTSTIEASPAIKLAEALVQDAVKVNVHDPEAIDNTKKVLRNSINYFEDVKKCINASDILVICTPWQEYIDMDCRDFVGKTVIDCWRIYRNKRVWFEKNTKYIPFGIGKL